MRIDREQHRRSMARTELQVKINDFQRESDLSNWEIISALAAWMELAAKYAIRREWAENSKEVETSVIAAGDAMRQRLFELCVNLEGDHLDEVQETMAAWVWAIR